MRVALRAINQARQQHDVSGVRCLVSPRVMRSLAALGLAVLLLMLGGCGDLIRLPLSGPGLQRVVAQGGQGAFHFWWLPPSQGVRDARLLLWDGASVGLGDPDALDQSFKPLSSVLSCSQVIPAPDGHAFACGQGAGGILVQSLDDLQAAPHPLVARGAPFSWSPDSHLLAGLREQLTGTVSTCSVVAVDPTLATDSPGATEVILDGIPFVQARGQTEPACPVQSLSWSPDGARLALSLVAPNGVALEVVRLGVGKQPSKIETQVLLPGMPVQLLDTPSIPSLFWSPDGQELAALTGYVPSVEDGLFLLTAGQQAPMAGPNLIDTGSGVALSWSPDSRWLAVGSVGARKGNDNALLRFWSRDERAWSVFAPMLVTGPSLAFSSDGTQLAVASAAHQGIALLDWPARKVSQVVPNRDLASLEQLGWAGDTTALLFTIGSRSATPPFEELYTQTIPVPTNAGALAYPTWFLTLLEHLPLGLIWLGGGLLALVVVALLLALADRGRSRRRRALIFSTLGVCSALFCLLLFTYHQVPLWIAQLYQPYGQQLCAGSVPASCSTAAGLAVLTVGGPLVLGLLVIALAVLLAGRRARGGAGLPKPIHHPFFERRQPASEEEPLLFLPAPVEAAGDAEEGEEGRR